MVSLEMLVRPMSSLELLHRPILSLKMLERPIVSLEKWFKRTSPARWERMHTRRAGLRLMVPFLFAVSFLDRARWFHCLRAHNKYTRTTGSW